MMASAVLESLQQFWPLSLLQSDDLKRSRRLIHRLSVPEATKQFIFAISDRKTGSVIYILTVQNLSKESVSDAENVIKEIKPDAVVAQISHAALPEIQDEEKLDSNTNSVPTSYFGVLRRCLIDKVDKNQYENLAGSLVLREIFGTGFYGHVLAAKRAAEKVDACFLLLESPHQNALPAALNVDTVIESPSMASILPRSSLFPRKATANVSHGSETARLLDPMEYQMFKMVTKSLSFSKADPVLEFTADDCQPRCNYQAPPFATVIYSLLAELHEIYGDLPAIGRALVYAQKMLTNVHEGEPVNAHLLTEVHNFRIAVEGLRVVLNSAARSPLKKLGNKDILEFYMLPTVEKCDALFTHALKNQTKKFKSVVAIVDAGTLSTLRRHWNTHVPSEEASLADKCFISFNDEYNNYESLIMEGMDRKWYLGERPMVAVGAGATAILGASSLSKALPASTTLLKLATYKVPSVLKVSLAYLERTSAFGLSKILGSTKILVPGMASNASVFKASASAVKIRRITHGVIASAEKTSLYAMRSAFYEIMRKRHLRPVRFAPWATFGFSMATCATLLSYGDGIECAAENAPSASTIASWGRGLQSLHQASTEVGQASKARLQGALHSLMNCTA